MMGGWIRIWVYLKVMIIWWWENTTSTKDSLELVTPNSLASSSSQVPGVSHQGTKYKEMIQEAHSTTRTYSLLNSYNTDPQTDWYCICRHMTKLRMDMIYLYHGHLMHLKILHPVCCQDRDHQGLFRLCKYFGGLPSLAASGWMVHHADLPWSTRPGYD